MRVVMKGVHLRVSNRLKQYVQESLVESLSRFIDNEAAMLEVHFVDSNGPKRGNDKECRVTLHIPGARSIHVEDAAEDPYKAVDLVRHRIEEAAKREMERMRSPGRDSELQAMGQGSGLP